MPVVCHVNLGSGVVREGTVSCFFSVLCWHDEGRGMMCVDFSTGLWADGKDELRREEEVEEHGSDTSTPKSKTE